METKNNKKNLLESLGLTSAETQVYLTLLKIGSSPVAKIAKEAGIYRPYVYDTLERLTDKGLVSFISRQNRKFYQAAHPQKLLEREETRIKELQEALPQLEAFLRIPKEETKVELFNGKEIVRIVQKDVLKTLKEKRGENLVLGVDEKRFIDADPIIMKQFFNQMKELKLKERVLVREGDNYLPAHKETTEYRFLPKEFFDPTSTFIYNNKVAIIIFGEPMHGLVIESKLLAGAYRKQFNLLWSIAKTKHL